MPLIDVVMTVKNGGRFLRQALDSLAAQTLPDFRLLICNDGSDDDTGGVIRGETRFPVIAIHHETSRGISASLNELLQIPSASPYIARFDGDDICQPDRFARQVAFLNDRSDIDLVGSWLEIIDEQGRTVGLHRYPTDPDGIRCELIFSDPIGNPSVMIRARWLRDTVPCYNADFSHSEDYELWCRLSPALRMANLPETLVRYRRHGDAVGVSHRPSQIAQMRAIRQRHVASLGLTAPSRDLLLSALGLGCEGAPVSARAAAGLLREFDARFPSSTSAHCRRSRDRIVLQLWRQLSASGKFSLALRDPGAARAYLARKLDQKTGGWRLQLQRRRDHCRRRRLARAVIRDIRRRGGCCEADFRIYGDPSQGERILLGEAAIVEHGCSFWLSSPEQNGTGRLTAGNHLFLGHNCRINVFADVTLGHAVSIGANSYLASNNHNYRRRDVTIQAQGFSGAPVRVEDDVWIGCNVVILPGVTIGSGSVIGAGSVVTRDVPAGEVWAGVPARKIKSR